MKQRHRLIHVPKHLLTSQVMLLNKSIIFCKIKLSTPERLDSKVIIGVLKLKLKVKTSRKRVCQMKWKQMIWLDKLRKFNRIKRQELIGFIRGLALQISLKFQSQLAGACTMLQHKVKFHLAINCLVLLQHFKTIKAEQN